MQDTLLHESIPHKTDNIPFSVHHTDVPANIPITLYLHWHEEFELFLVTKGSTTFHIDDRSYLLSEGEAVFVNANCLHSASPVPGSPCSFSAILFHPSMLSRMDYGHLFLKYVQPLLTNSIQFSEHLTAAESWMEQVLSGIHRLLSLSASVGEHELLILSTLFEIWNTFFLHGKANINTQPSLNQRYLSLLKPALEYMHGHYNEPISLKLLSAQIPISISYFNHIFKEVLKQSPIEYLLRYRLYQSCLLLSSANMKIADIASQVGFNNISYFNREFIKEFHCTPSTYREQQRNSDSKSRELLQNS